eukprot:TRINITY_DN113582_c0_g1_i1.p1 TRINITY_DN113582_c0_g1~~TRINITY_DN113582_c0_g1_i1.p1  ORF type:complete len:168 (-),score=29.80 TRINITY_DN113582_c0_g1_i1:262-690(-)
MARFSFWPVLAWVALCVAQAAEQEMQGEAEAAAADVFGPWQPLRRLEGAGSRFLRSTTKGESNGGRLAFLSHPVFDFVIAAIAGVSAIACLVTGKFPRKHSCSLGTKQDSPKAWMVSIAIGAFLAVVNVVTGVLKLMGTWPM